MEGPAFKNAVTFAPHSGAKVLAPLPGSLAQQGFRGIPRPDTARFCSTKVF